LLKLIPPSSPEAAATTGFWKNPLVK